MSIKPWIILSVLLLVCSIALCDEQKASTPEVRQARSLVQACRKEVRSLCPGSMRSLNKCMQEKVEQVNDATCKKWVQASASCDTAAAASAKCGEKDTPRACLRKLAKGDLPDDCTSSDYYKSIRMTARRFPTRPLPAAPKKE
jgi:hypothetical protein